MRIPFELRCQIGEQDWDKISKTEKLRALAWAMESIIMGGTTKMTKGEENKIRSLESIRRSILRDGIIDIEDKD